MGNAESNDQFYNELDGHFSVKFYGLGFDPLGVLVHRYEQVRYSSSCRLKGPYHIQPLDRERPSDWYGFELFCQQMLLLGIELASFASLYEAFGICFCR